MIISVSLEVSVGKLLFSVAINAKHKTVMQNWIINKCNIMFIPYGTWIVEQSAWVWLLFIYHYWLIIRQHQPLYFCFLCPPPTYVYKYCAHIQKYALGGVENFVKNAMCNFCKEIKSVYTGIIYFPTFLKTLCQ